MDFRKLSYFEAVCRLGNFTKASKELHVSQPSVTMAIRSLEENLNVQLIKRNREGIVLTAEGEILYKKTQHILSELEEVKKEIQTIATRKNTTIQIGYSVQMRHAILNIVNKFKDKYTNVNLITNESSTPSIIKQIEDGILDLGVVVLTKETREHYKIYPLFNGEIKVCISKKNPLSKNKKITFETFEKETLISLSLNDPKDSFIFKIMKEFYEDNTITIKPKFSSLQLESYFQHIANNDGIGVTFHDIWFNCYQYNINSTKELPYMEIPFEPPCIYTVGIITKKKQTISKDTKSFIEYVKSELEESYKFSL
ncbi:LysR family transcriptional regulator [Romboutsia sp.]|uniref:LysR family transcriptional regulator n=1 Tax=Romboutsia sp. TaxID=1965302 RepID=UPI003F2F4EF0